MNPKYFIDQASSQIDDANNEILNAIFSGGDENVQCSAIEDTIDHLEQAIEFLKEAKEKLNLDLMP